MVSFFLMCFKLKQFNRWGLSIDLLQGSLQRLLLFQPLLEFVDPKEEWLPTGYCHLSLRDRKWTIDIQCIYILLQNVVKKCLTSSASYDNQIMNEVFMLCCSTGTLASMAAMATCHPLDRNQSFRIVGTWMKDKGPGTLRFPLESNSS